MIRIPMLTLAGLIVLGAVAGTVAYLALTHLGRHLGSPGPRRRRVSGLGEKWEAHQSERLGFSARVR